MPAIPCMPGCTCGRHSHPRCAEGCTCYRHKGKTYLPDPKDWNNSAYFIMHKKVRAERGRASEHKCVSCNDKAEHWAQRHEEDGTQTGHYDPMCISCHHAYGKTHERAGFHGHTHSEESRKKMSEARKGKSWLHDATDEQRAKFRERISKAQRAKSEAFREWAVIRYPDMILSRKHRVPDEIREAWRDYQWWQRYNPSSVNQLENNG